jgi:hypothetical protein
MVVPVTRAYRRILNLECFCRICIIITIIYHHIYNLHEMRRIFETRYISFIVFIQHYYHTLFAKSLFIIRNSVPFFLESMEVIYQRFLGITNKIDCLVIIPTHVRFYLL